MYYQKNTKATYLEIKSYIFLIGFGTVISLLIGRLYGLSKPSELLAPMLGGIIVSLMLCLKYYNGYRKAEQEAIKKETEYRKRDIRSWCEDVHRQDAPYWLIHSQIEGAKRRESNEELQYYYY